MENNVGELIFGFLFAIFCTILIFINNKVRHGTEAIAYPGQEPQPTSSFAYPGPFHNGSSTSTPQPTVSSINIDPTELNSLLYLPIVYKEWKKVQFSIAGAVLGNDDMLEVIPENLLISPYAWASPAFRDGTYWHYANGVQVVHSCFAERIKGKDTVGRVILESTCSAWSNGMFCWDPVSEQFARIVQVNCPLEPPPGQQCAILETTTATNLFTTLIQQNPHWVWLVANEPDNWHQDALNEPVYVRDGNGTPQLYFTPGPATYATLFANMYDLVDQALAGTNYKPKLGFCQATYADDDHGNWGLPYCANAFDVLPTALDVLNITIPASETIYALSVHEYFQGCYFITLPGQPPTQYCTGRLMDSDIIDYAVEQVWITHLQEFEQWAKNTPGLENKPLWLTEFGSFLAWCHEVHPNNFTSVPGLPCLGTGRDNVYYGRFDNEGIWGLQIRQIRYLSRADNNWKAAWWYVSRMEHINNLCGYSAWIWGDSYDCAINRYDLSRAGETYRDTVACEVNHVCS